MHLLLLHMVVMLLLHQSVLLLLLLQDIGSMRLPLQVLGSNHLTLLLLVKLSHHRLIAFF